MLSRRSRNTSPKDMWIYPSFIYFNNTKTDDFIRHFDMMTTPLGTINLENTFIQIMRRIVDIQPATRADHFNVYQPAIDACGVKRMKTRQTTQIFFSIKCVQTNGTLFGHAIASFVFECERVAFELVLPNCFAYLEKDLVRRSNITFYGKK